MSTIHMETERVRQIARQMTQAAADMLSKESSPRSASGTLSIAWQGGEADDFHRKLGVFLKDCDSHVQQLQDLALRLSREVDEWEETDDQKHYSDTAGVMGSVPFFAAIREQLERFKESLERSARINEARRRFKENWKSWSDDERKQFLQGRYDEFVKANGLTPAKLTFENLPDKYLKIGKYTIEISDAKGVYRGPDLALDTDDLNDPEEVLNTLYHESRHQRQWHYVQNPDQLPKDVSKGQVDTWRDNYNNYIEPKDDYQGYRNQPIEKDARDYANRYADDFYATY